MDMPVSPDEWRVFGPRLIDEYTKLTHDAVRDPGKVSDLMATLVNIAGRPRDDMLPDHEAGVEVFDMVCTAHAVLSAAECMAMSRKSVQWPDGCAAWRSATCSSSRARSAIWLHGPSKAMTGRRRCIDP